MKMKIEVVSVGSAFACQGLVKARAGRVIARTRLFPFGFDASARQAAEDLAREIAAKRPLEPRR